MTDRIRGLSSSWALVQRFLPAAPDVIVVETTDDTDTDSRTRSQLDELLRGLDPPLPTFVPVAPDEALTATDAMRRGDATEFSTRYLHSGIPQLSDALVHIAATSTPARSAATLATQAAASALVHLGDEAALLDEASDVISVFESHTQRIRREVRAAVVESGCPPTEDARRSREAIEKTIEKRLSWWKLPRGRIDEIGAVLAYSLEAAFLRRYETELAFEAGRLAGVASAASERVDILLASSPFAESAESSLHSAVLLNTLAQLVAKPSAQLDLTPDVLSRPIAARRAQLLARGGPVEHLQRKAQLALVRSGAVFMTGPATAYLAYQAIYLTAASLGGLSALSVALAAWLLQRGYGKAVRRFFSNYDRVIDGLGHDIERTIDDVIDEAVFAKSLAAISGVRNLIATRRTALNESLSVADALQKRAIELKADL